MNKPNENDWKLISKYKDVYLNRLCDNINNEIRVLANTDDLTPHDKYIKIYNFVKHQDRIIALIFNDWKRSNFFNIVDLIIINNLYGDEIYELSPETKLKLNLFNINNYDN